MLGLTTAVVDLASRVLMAINISPNTSIPGTSSLETFVGGIETVCEVGCLLAIIIGAGQLAFGRSAGNLQASGNGRSMVGHAVLGLIIIGSLSLIAKYALSIPLGVGVGG